MYWKTAIFIFICFGSFSFASESSAETAPHFIWWSPAPSARTFDGRESLVLTLEASPNFNPDKPPEAWLRVTPQRRFNQPGEPAKAHWRQGEWSSIEPWTLAVQAGEYVRVEAFARAEIAGRPHYAQTRLLLYGQSGEDGSVPGDLAAPPNRPKFQVSSSGELYWPQTGHAFVFTLDGLETGELEVWNGQGELLDQARDLAGVFKYTPAHDPALNRAGIRAGKPLIFVARNSDGDSASYTLVVHRSRWAGFNLRAGLAVFTTAFLLSGLGVGLTRLKVRPC